MKNYESQKKLIESQIKMIQEKLVTRPKEGGIYSFDFNFGELKNQEIVLKEYLELITQNGIKDFEIKDLLNRLAEFEFLQKFKERLEKIDPARKLECLIFCERYLDSQI